MHLSIILHVNTVTLLAEQNNLVQSHSTASSHCIVNVVVNALKKSGHPKISILESH